MVAGIPVPFLDDELFECKSMCNVCVQLLARGAVGKPLLLLLSKCVSLLVLINLSHLYPHLQGLSNPILPESGGLEFLSLMTPSHVQY